LPPLVLRNGPCPDGPLDFSGTEASRAGMYSPGVAVDYGTDPLDIGGIGPLGLNLRVTYAVADRLGLAADLAPGHEKNLLTGHPYDPSIVA